jgi:hypothetical protein
MCPEKWSIRDYGHIKCVYVPGKAGNQSLWSHSLHKKQTEMFLSALFLKMSMILRHLARKHSRRFLFPQ